MRAYMYTYMYEAMSDVRIPSRPNFKWLFPHYIPYPSAGYVRTYSIVDRSMSTLFADND